jgi:hypothetical protein
VGDGVDERRPAFVAAKAAPRQFARMHQLQPRRPAGMRIGSGGGASAGIASRPARNAAAQRRVSAPCVPGRPRPGGGPPPADRPAAVIRVDARRPQARRFFLASSERNCWMRSK